MAPQGFGGTVVRAVVSAIKKAGAAVWKACVKAVKAGAKKFAAWWSKQAPALRAAVKVIANLTAAELFHLLWDYLF